MEYKWYKEIWGEMWWYDDCALIYYIYNIKLKLKLLTGTILVEIKIQLILNYNNYKHYNM